MTPDTSLSTIVQPVTRFIMATRKHYSQEFKLKAVKLVTEQAQSPTAVARSLGA
ncbi:transposase [Endozoicomonas sp. ALC020]|uniref:transposase n=1 Tax=unclassified Endozoicomonas TaxID=2644528 RepID=UPI003BAFFCC2